MSKIYLMITLLLIASSPTRAQKIFQMMGAPWNYSLDELKQSADSFSKTANEENESFEEIIQPTLHEFELHTGKNGKMINYAAATWDAYYKYQKNHDVELKSASNGTWSFLGPADVTSTDVPGIGRINAVKIISSSTWLAGGATGGLWKTTDEGASWQCLTDGLPDIGISDIAVDPGNANIIYILTGDGDAKHIPSIGVLKTSDGGFTWQSTGLSWKMDDEEYGNKLVIDPADPNVLWVATTKGLYRSSDGAYSWTIVRSGHRYFDVELKPNDHNYVIAATKDSIFYNQNYVSDSDNFVAATSDTPIVATARIELAVAPNASNYIYAVCIQDDGSLFGIYLSTNSGVDFKQKSGAYPNLMATCDTCSGGQGTTDIILTVNPTNKKDVIVGGKSIDRSTNSGKDFTSIYFSGGLHFDQHGSGWNGGKLVIGNDGGVFEYNSDLTSSTPKNNGLAVTQYYDIGSDPFDETHFGAGSQDNGMHLGTSASSVFTQAIFGDFFDVIFHPFFEDIIVANQHDADIHISFDGGLSFTDNEPIPGTYEAAFASPLEIDANGRFYTSIEGGIYKGYASPGYPINWSSINEQDGLQFKQMSFLACGISNTNRFYALYKTNGKGYLLRSDDVYDGTPDFYQPYTDDYKGLLNAASDIEIDPDHSLHVYITLSGYDDNMGHVYESNDGVTTLIDISGSLPNVPVYCAACDGASNNGIYIGTDIGVFYRNDDLGDWIYYSNGMPIVAVRDLEVLNSIGKLRAATYGRGAWESPLYGGCSEAITITPADYDEGNYYEEVQSTIVSTAFINGSDGNNVTYVAGDYTKLDVGFECQAGAQFTAFIGDCNSSGNKIDLSGIFTGAMNAPGNEPFDPNGDKERAFTIYPNPACNEATCSFKLDTPSHVFLRAVSIEGNEIFRILEADLEAGKQEVKIPIQSMSKGIYLLEMTDDYKSVFQKLIVQ